MFRNFSAIAFSGILYLVEKEKVSKISNSWRNSCVRDLRDIFTCEEINCGLRYFLGLLLIWFLGAGFTIPVRDFSDDLFFGGFLPVILKIPGCLS